MDRNLALELVRVTEAAALAAARFHGKGDPDGAERAAADAMELAMRGVKVSASVVIGDESLENGSPLSRGRTVGAGGDTEIEIVLDPLESKISLSEGASNAISAIALGPKGTFHDIKCRYMQKIAVGPEAADSIDLDASVFDNLVRIAQAKRVYVEDLTVAIPDRKKHEDLISEVRRAGARIELYREGDLAAAMSAALPGTGIDVMMGYGRSRQGVIAAAALSCMRGGFQARFIKRDEEMGIEGAEDPGRVYGIRDLTGESNIMFAVTGVSRSAFLEGVLFRPGGAVTHSLALRGRSGTIRTLRTEHFFDRDPDYT